MRKKTCAGCHELFLPDPRSYRPEGKKGKRRSIQRFCSKPDCQKASHQESNRSYWKSDGETRARNRLACREWRKKNKDYWQGYRADHRAYVERNRELQKKRDGRDLANTDSILSLRDEKLKRIGVLVRLANTDSTKVTCTLVSEEIYLFLRGEMRLVNTNSIPLARGDKPQSQS